ncbi:MAG: hypothetical protein OMM_05050 [Candidatus Magnetoglobus multicellularis str. Araruama]|uniref:Spore protein YkvP/CgeB glycosyl transferase-like domain-containing protein n=1 Tax=Candidatus Magnetoglobus multicellularis str. Araruama TaxID=890399 RepID=A0A1V1NYH6_9BACT|nr:MAG: hypothetical protein OMM_05050 [Candidatus Magnetoglobus multicellularis str. Araruama]
MSTNFQINKGSNQMTLRFMQIHTFYTLYLHTLYQKNPSLKKASYQKQIQALLYDGFSVIHMYTPYMQQYGYETLLVIANNPFSQSQWLRENNMTIENENNWMLEIVQKQVETMKPDILYLSDSIAFDSHFLRKLSWKPRLVFGWRGSNIPSTTDWSDFDFILSHLSVCRKRALEIGSKSVEHFYPGFSPYLAEQVKDQPKLWDVVFSGQVSVLHQKRNQYINKVFQASVNKEKKFSTGFFLPPYKPGLLHPEIDKFNFGARWGLEMYRALKAGRIVINAEIDLACGEAGNMRLFETTGVGAFLLTEYHDNIHQYFEPGVEIETFKNENEMIEKIHYYLKNDAKRESIAMRGHQRCLKDYSMEKKSFCFQSDYSEVFLF